MWQVILDGLFVLNEHTSIIFGAIILLALGYSVNLYFNYKLVKREVGDQSNFSFALLILFFIFSVIVRLAYIRDLFAPPYFDSVEHLRIVNALANGFRSSTLLELLPNITPNYYHLGFHFFASLLSFGLHADPTDVILAFGQVILAAIPVPIFFLILYKTQNSSAAFFSLILAGFGWYMPGYAVNWGKYPALAGLLAFEIVLSLAYTTSPKKASRKQFLLVIILRLQPLGGIDILS